jgi:hypothetical protein
MLLGASYTTLSLLRSYSFWINKAIFVSACITLIVLVPHMWKAVLVTIPWLARMPVAYFGSLSGLVGCGVGAGYGALLFRASWPAPVLPSAGSAADLR